jgi:hypothetical protein
MSDAPRTDAFAQREDNEVAYYAALDFARELERALSDAVRGEDQAYLERAPISINGVRRAVRPSRGHPRRLPGPATMGYAAHLMARKETVGI